MKDALKYRTRVKSLDAFLKNLEYVEKHSNNFEEEMDFIEQVFKYKLKNTIKYDLSTFFYLLGKIENELFFNQFVGLVYSLRSEIKDEENLIFLQNLFFESVKSRFEMENKFSKKLNTSGAYLRDFIGYSQEENSNKLIFNTMRILYELSKHVIYLDMQAKIKKTYLESITSELNRLSDFIEGRIKPREGTESSEELESNNDLLKQINEKIAYYELELFYLILYKIEKDSHEKELFEVAEKIYHSGELEKKGFYKHQMFSGLDWLNYDSFKGGAQTIRDFNLTKYKILMSFYKFIQENKTGTENFDKENFSDYVSPSFEKEIDNLESSFYSLYFSFKQPDLTKFKKEFKKEFKKRKESIKNQEEDYIKKTPIKDEFRKKFINDCVESWKKDQKKLKNYIDISNLKGGKDIKENFGQYTLCDKIWFIDSFDKGTSYDRSLGFNFAREQILGKEKEIQKKILDSFNPSKDFNKKINSFQDFLERENLKGEFIFFYNKDLWEQIHLIHDIDWNSKYGEDASIKNKDFTIYLYYTNFLETNILYKKGEFLLNQYNQGFKDYSSSLYVDVKDLTEEQIKGIVKAKKLKLSPEELRKKVEIRVSEKFEVKRLNKSEIYKIEVKK